MRGSEGRTRFKRCSKGQGMRCEAAFSPTFSATHFSPTVGATPKIQPSVYKHYLYCIQVGNFNQNHHIFSTSVPDNLFNINFLSATPKMRKNMLACLRYWICRIIVKPKQCNSLILKTIFLWIIINFTDYLIIPVINSLIFTRHSCVRVTWVEIGNNSPIVGEHFERSFTLLP